MFEFIRRLGLLPLTRMFRRNALKRRHRRLAFRSEALESRVLLAADLGAAYSDTIPVQYAFYFSLSRGTDELLRNAGYGFDGSRLSTPAVNANELDATFEQPELAPSSSIQSLSAVASETPEFLPQPTTEAPAEIALATDLAISEALPSDGEGAESEPGDIEIQVGETSFVIYNELDGELRVETVDPVGTISIVSESEIFTQTENAVNLDGDFDIARPDEIFKIDFGGGFDSVSFGNVAESGLTEEFINNDLEITGAPPLGTGGGTLSGKDVVVDLSVLDTSGTVIETVNVGENFVLRATVEDTRFGPNEDPNNLTGGVFAAFMDVAFDGTLATADSIEYGDTYDTARTGTISDGLIDELGGVAGSINPIGKSAQVLFEVELTATSMGELVFSTNAADQFPASETLLFGVNDPIDPLRIRFDTASVTVNAPNPEENDLVAFAQALADSGTIFYGASWCPHCTEQKELFEDGQDLLPFVEVTNYENEATLNNINQVGIDNNITSFPTWVFPDGTRLEGQQDLATLSDRSGVPIPQSNEPTIVGLDDVDLLSGSPLQLVLNGWDPNGDNLRYEVESSDSSLVEPTLIDGGRSLLIDVAGPTTFGKMQFQLFENRAPRATGQIIALAEEGFYDGVSFHRIIDEFVIQGGDPTGTGSGGSDLGDFDDDFHPDLQHNQTGILSMAKSFDDTNDSQFFITEDPDRVRQLDFNHSIFGILTEGEGNREAISNTFTEPGDRPAVDVIMDSVTVIDDNENAIVQLKAPEGAEGTADITVRAIDPAGNTYTQTIQVTVTPDTVNGQPFLEDIVELDAYLDEPFALPAIDVEGDMIFSQIAPVDSGTFTASTDGSTGEITITSGTVGTTTADVWVSSSSQPTLNVRATNDFQQGVTLNLGPTTPIVDLQASSDLGSSNSDNLTSADTLDFEITNLMDGATVELFSVDGDTETSIGTGTATSDSVVISTDDLTTNGTFNIIARQTLNNLPSLSSEVLSIEIDRQDLSGFTSTAPTGNINADIELTYNTEHPNEGDTGFVYSLANAPTGVALDPETGELTWTPTDSQVGQHVFSIVVDDEAGNTASQEIDVNVVPNVVVGVRLEVTDLSGETIVAVQQGREYQLNAYVDDLRSSGDRGLTQAYFDVEFDGMLTSAANTDSENNVEIEYSDDFPDGRSEVASAQGTFDEIGASTSAVLGGDEILLWSITMSADDIGTVNFAANMPETTQFALTNFSNSIGENNVEFVGTSLVITNEIFAQPDTVEADEDGGQITIPALANDIAKDGGEPLSIDSVNDPVNGSASVSGDNVLYTPDPDFNGTDVFEYTITDGTDSTAGTITVNVNPVNDAPIAVDDTFTVEEDSVGTTLDVLENDTDIDGDDLTISDVTEPTNGTVEISGDGSTLSYTPDADFVGSDSFEYTISDGTSTDDPVTGMVDVTVTARALDEVRGVVRLGNGGQGVSRTEIHLIGEDVNGDPVDQTIMTDNDGSFSLSSVLPGSYTISAPKLPFMVNTSGGSNSMDIELTTEGLGDQTIDFGDNIVNPKFAIWESFSSVTNDGIYAAVSTTGGELWFRELEGWSDVVVQDIAFSADQESLVITVENADGATESATVALTDASRVRVIGHEGDARLIRVIGPSTSFSFTAVAAETEA